jgi:hypothetical protein
MRREIPGSDSIRSSLRILPVLALSLLLTGIGTAGDAWLQEELRPLELSAGEFPGITSADLRIRNETFVQTGTWETLAPYPAPLDQRREEIIAALWNNDESAFYELSKSPITNTGGLVNQDFDDLSRTLRKLDRRPLRTLRYHPVFPPEELSVWCRHQWGSLGRDGMPIKRGNLVLIFDKEDWSLQFVRIVFFEESDGYLPAPLSQIPNDPAIDRQVPGEEEK